MFGIISITRLRSLSALSAFVLCVCSARAALTTPVNTDLAITYGEAGNPADSYAFNLYAAPEAPAYIHGGDNVAYVENNYTGSEGGDFGTGANHQTAFYFRSSSPGTFTFELQYFDYINYNPISPRATVTVVVTGGNTAPAISDVAHRATSVGTSTGSIAVTIGDAETAATALSLTGSSNNTALVPHANIVFGGSGTNRTVSVTPAPGQTGTATITLTVTDANNATATDIFVLTVTEPRAPLLVTTTADSGLDATTGASLAIDVTDGAGLSLREAVHWANTDDDADIIGFSSSLEGTITLGSVLSISKDLTIQGPGASVLGVSGGGTTRVFAIDDGSIATNADVTIRGLTITGSADELHPELGISFGAMEAVENVTVEHCVFIENAGMALTAYGYDGDLNPAGTFVLAISNTVFTDNAQGAIYGYGGGVLRVNHSTFTGNGSTESLSGAIQTSGTLSVEISSSYIAGNRSGDYGPAVYLYKASRPGVSGTLTNLTITDNTAGGNASAAVFANGVPTTLQNSTLYNNNISGTSGRSSELYVSLTSATVNNSIIWHSTYGALSGTGTNATIRVDNASTLTINNSVAGSHITSVVAPTRNNSISQNPLLGAVAANGGPTLTLSLQNGSPAINLGSAVGAPAIDGRGFTRNTVGGVDAGAYERAATTFEFAGEPTPLPGALDVNPTANLMVDYGHSVAKNSGTITIRNADTSATIESFDVTDSRVSIDGGRVVIDPSATLPTSTSIEVDVAAGAFSASVDGVSATSLEVAGENQFYFETSASAPAAPEIAISANGNAIADGANTPSTTNHTDFGDAAVPGGTISRTFTIANSGTAALTLSGDPKVSLSGTHAADFSVTAQPSSPVSADGGTTSFTILFTPSVVGTRMAEVSLTSDDSDESPYTFAILGTGVDGTPPTVLSVERLDPTAQRSNASAFVFRVTYSEAVEAVDASEFAIEAVNGGTVVGTVTGVSGTGAMRDVTVSITSGSGEFRLTVISPVLEP